MGRYITRDYRTAEARSIDAGLLAVGSRIGLIASAALLAAAPLALGPGYSFLEHTLSESGGQGVGGAWVHRGGVLLAAASVFVMTVLATPVWGVWTRRLIRSYVLALVLLVVFPESPYHGGPHDPFVAMLHTWAAAFGAVSFILGVASLALGRGEDQHRVRTFDLIVIGAIVLLPQAMLVTPYDGGIQRLMVALGYGWLFWEMSRLYRRLPERSSGNAMGRDHSPLDA